MPAPRRERRASRPGVRLGDVVRRQPHAATATLAPAVTTYVAVAHGAGTKGDQKVRNDAIK